MKVLIIEDTESKAITVTEVVKSTVGDALLEEIVVATALSEAAQAIAVGTFDLIILDLMVPYLPKGRPERGAGLELLREIRKPTSKNRSALIVGLSAYPDEVEAARPEFEKMAVLILKFDDKAEWRESVSRICSDAIWLSKRNFNLDFLIFVALDEELEAFRSTGLIFDILAPVEGLNVNFVHLEGNQKARGAIIKVRRMGLVSATVDSAYAIPLFKPSIVAMTGICAGFSSEVELGQLVAASPSWEYQAGKWSQDDFLIEPYQISMRPSTRVVCEQLFSNDTFVAELESNAIFAGNRPSVRSRAKVAPSVTGSAVIADGTKLSHISPQHRKLSGLDMETYGIYTSSSEADWFVEHYFSIKTVVDFADKEKDDSIHGYGAAVSAMAGIKIIERLMASPS